MADLVLTPEELETLTGYRQPHAQLRELRRQGFHRARRNPAGAVILERAHYQAVCAGTDVAPVKDQPMLKSERRRLAAA